jgi:hypothetical protein
MPRPGHPGSELSGRHTRSQVDYASNQQS